MIIKIEVWKPVLGYEGRYEVSNWGRVRSLGVKYWHKPNQGWKQKRPRILKLVIHKTGKYPVVTLHSGGKQRTYRVHVLVLTAFRGPCPEGHLSRHLDGIPANVRLSNLRWGTAAQNMADMVKHGRAGRGERLSGEQHPQAKLTWEKVNAIRQSHAQGTAIKVLAKAYGVDRNTLRYVVRNETWKEAAHG